MVLYRILIIFALLFSNISTIPMDNNILYIISTAEEIVIYQDGTETQLNSSEENFKSIAKELIKLSDTCREYPAFGVSLHNETVEAMKSGLWIEFKFPQTLTYNEMPFDTLVIEVIGEYSGFNIIRKFNDKYDGRCFHVNLIDTDLSSLEELLKSIV